MSTQRSCYMTLVPRMELLASRLFLRRRVRVLVLSGGLWPGAAFSELAGPGGQGGVAVGAPLHGCPGVGRSLRTRHSFVGRVPVGLS